MNILNKNVGRTIGILLLLTLFYMGLCFEAAALYPQQSPTDVIKVGELYELDGGYSIKVVIADVESGGAKFVLYKEGEWIDETYVSSGERFYLYDGEIFYLEATLDKVFHGLNTDVVELTDYNWVWEEPRLYVMAVEELLELDEGYSIKVEEADIESGEAKFALYKEGKTIDETFVSSGERFYLYDVEIFYFQATLDSVFSSNDAIKVELTDYYWEEEPPLYVMAVGELIELDERYSIKVVEAELESGEAKFALDKEGKTIDETFVSSGERFYLDDVEIFYFQATLESVSGSKDAIKVELTDFNLDWGETFLDVMAVGEPLELDEVYSILVEEANIKEKKAQFVLYKEERGIDFITVSEGEFFILSDGENFYFAATLDSVFRSEDRIKVGLTDKDYYYEVYKYSPVGDYLILALIVFLLSSLSFFFYQRHKKKKLLEKEYQSKMEEKIARLEAESHFTQDRFNNVEIELKRIGEFMDMQPRENPYIAGGAVDDTRFWIGNENLINRVLASISGNHFFIRGERRSGKTTLLRRIDKALEMKHDPETSFIPVYVSLQGIPPEMFFQSLYNAIASKVNINPSEFEEIVDAEDFINALSYIIESLNNSSSTKSIIALLLDEFEIFNSYPIDVRESFRTVFMGHPEFSGYIRLIATGTELTVWTRSSPMNYLIELEIEPLTANEARGLILKPAIGVVSFDEAAVDRIIEITHGRPFDIQKICEQLINTAIQKRLYRIKVEDVEVVSGLINTNRREDSK